MCQMDGVYGKTILFTKECLFAVPVSIMHYAKNISEHSVKKKLASTVPCKSTLYKRVAK